MGPRMNNMILEWCLYSLVIIGVLGALLNMLALKINDGKMPVFYDWSLFARVLNSPRHKFIDEETRLYYLCDIIPIANTRISVGDILIAIYLGLGSITLFLIVLGFFCSNSSQ